MQPIRVNIYTDGASRGNPGPGGYGIVMESGNLKKEFAEGFKKTTNNRMELLAVIVALESLKRNNIVSVVYSDSKYVVDAVNQGWVFGWHKRGYKGKKNPDLWRRLLPLYQKFKPKFVWIKGHSNHPQNERCDTLAVQAALGGDLKPDVGYEEAQKSEGMF
jgi:ribonuclease HI